MPRRNSQNRRRDDRPSRPAAGSHETTETYRGEEFTVRAVSGQATTKPYRCPGCDQLIVAGTSHVVAWAYGDVEADDRRHWHRACWNAREHRTPGVQRSRNAPRY